MGSSIEKIQEKLNTASGCITFCATTNFTMYMHHCASHIGIREDQGVTYSEVITEGYLHVLSKSRYTGQLHDRLVITHKNKCEDMSQIEAVTTTVRAFIAPLWIPKTPLL